MKYQKGEFVTIPNVHKLRELTLGARATFMEICVYADGSGKCFPKRKTIADNINMHPNSVDRFIEELEEAGLLRKVKRYRNDGSLTSNEYQILLIETPSRTGSEGGTHTHSDTPITTHSEAELNPYRTKPTISKTEVLQGDYTIVSLDEKEKRPPTAKYPNAPAITALFKEILGTAPLNWKTNRTQLIASENLFTERGLEKVRNALNFYIENKDREYCPEILSPYDLDTKWTKLSSFKKKSV